MIIDPMNYGMLECHNDLNSTNSANTYNEALNRVITGDVEFVEFPLDSLGSSVKELLESTTQIYRNWHDYYDYYEIENRGKFDKEDFIAQFSNFLKMTFINRNSESSSLIASKIYETFDNILQCSAHINLYYEDITLNSTPFDLIFGNSLIWHADYGGAPHKLYLSVLIALKGPGTKFCQLSHEDRNKYNLKQYSTDDSDVDSYLNSGEGIFLTQACSNSSNIFQVKTGYGVVYKSDKDFSAIHSPPDYWGERLVLRVTLTTRSEN